MQEPVFGSRSRRAAMPTGGVVLKTSRSCLVGSWPWPSMSVSQASDGQARKWPRKIEKSAQGNGPSGTEVARESEHGS